MADASADAPPAMSDAQAETLRVVVGNLRRCLPDPSARVVHDAIAEHDGATLRLKEGGTFYAPSPITCVAVHWPKLAAGAQSGELYHLEVQE